MFKPNQLNQPQPSGIHAPPHPQFSLPLLNQPLANTNPTSNNGTTQNLPSIQRIIPAQGPIRGGIEVTLLGFNFRPGLAVKFGSNNALATHCWSETTIVTYLPPASQPGQVLVSFENHENMMLGGAQQQQVFTYTDDTDRQLIELALQIVGLKMNGKLEDAKNIAKRIVGSDNNNSNNNEYDSNEDLEYSNDFANEDDYEDDYEDYEYSDYESSDVESSIEDLNPMRNSAIASADTTIEDAPLSSNSTIVPLNDNSMADEEDDHSVSSSNGLWQKVKNVFNNDQDNELPSYDDLFPFGPSSFHSSKPKTQAERNLNLSVEGSSEELRTSASQEEEVASDSSEDMLLLRSTP
ncbi:hypothetical protein QCA50_018815 [Cerrena zonata]|uniref:IPT/TIG domain-containing protein n=1 Tax=Cerrena zonata TaxID=2478898 RepID=A0AAW0FKW4_9APHY